MDTCMWANLIPTIPKTLPYVRSLIQKLDEYTVGSHVFYLLFDYGERRDDAERVFKELERTTKNIFLGSPRFFRFGEFSTVVNTAVNSLNLAHDQYIMVWNDDMVPGPNWDAEMWSAVKRNGERFVYVANTIDSGTASSAADLAAPRTPDMMPLRFFGADPSAFEHEDFEQYCWDWQQQFAPGAIIRPHQWFMPFLMKATYYQAVGGYPLVEPYPFANDVVFFDRLKGMGIQGVTVPRAVIYHYGQRSVIDPYEMRGV